MIAYHGSVYQVERPDIDHSKRFLDFGPGFYVTTYKTQAERWAVRKAMRSGKDPIVNIYTLCEHWEAYKVLSFEKYDDTWLDFVCDCRRGSERYKQFDIVIGGVADDDVFKTVDLYFRGIWDREKVLGELRYFRRNNQIAFISQAALSALMHFRGSYEVEGPKA